MYTRGRPWETRALDARTAATQTAMSKPVLKKQATNKEGEDLAEPLPAELQTIEGLRAADVKVYGAAFSPPCWKVWALLNYYGVPFEKVEAQPHHVEVASLGCEAHRRRAVGRRQIDLRVVVQQEAHHVETTNPARSVHRREALLGLLVDGNRVPGTAASPRRATYNAASEHAAAITSDRWRSACHPRNILQHR